jgi:YbbR domain-containing protein
MAALIISVFHRMGSFETRFFSTQLRIETNDTLVPVDLQGRVARISLKGDINSINTILDEDIEVYIDLQRYTLEGSYQVPVQVRKKGSAVGIEPLEIKIDPMEISLELERKINRNIAVTPVFRGTVADGYQLTSQTINPPSLTVEGPRSIVETITGFKTDIIDLEGRYEDFSIQVNIIHNEPLIVIRGNSTIEFRCQIRPVNPDEKSYLSEENE